MAMISVRGGYKHRAPTKIVRCLLGGRLGCSMCGEDASAYWHGCGVGDVIRVCRRCAVEKLPLLIADAIGGPLDLDNPPRHDSQLKPFVDSLPEILAAFWRGVAIVMSLRIASPREPSSFDSVSECLPTGDDPPAVYRGVRIQWDEDRDERILRFIDEMGSRFRNRLVSAGEHEGSLELGWRGHPPRGYREGDQVVVDDDCWQITRSVDTSEANGS